MVYNAMKLFMEVNPQLFDECSHNYAEKQNSSPTAMEIRQSAWERVAREAQSNMAAKRAKGAGASEGGVVSGPWQGSTSSHSHETSSKDKSIATFDQLLPLTAGHGAKMPPPPANGQMDGASEPDLMSQERLGRLKDLSIHEDSIPGMPGRANAGGLR